MNILPPFRLLRWMPLLAALGLTACATSAGIAPQSHQLSVSAAAAATLDPDPPLSAVPSWVVELGDPQLSRLVAQALKDNPRLREAGDRIRAAQAQADIVKADTGPNLTAGASMVRERFPANQFFPPPIAGATLWNNEALIRGGYQLDLWGQHRAAIAAATSEIQANIDEARHMSLVLTTLLVQTYAQYALQRERNALYQQQIAALSRIVAITEQRYRHGLVDEDAVDGWRAEWDRLRQSAVAGEAQANVLGHQLMALAGVGPDAAAALVSPRLVTGGFVLPKKLPLELLGRRADLQAQLARIRAAGHRIEVAHAAFYPNLDLTALLGWQALGITNFIRDSALSAAAGPALSLPIFDGGRRRGQLAQQTTAYDQAVAAYNTMLLEDLQAVADQLARLRAGQTQTGLLTDLVASATRRQDAARKRWQAGLLDEQPVLIAQLELWSSQAALLSVERAELVDWVGLILALGGPWQ